ncbi:MAG: sugar transferase [Verrucomicrobia bacterium]|nr:sugar transferase [Verrucomicrobiota bacterium]
MAVNEKVWFCIGSQHGWEQSAREATNAFKDVGRGSALVKRAFDAVFSVLGLIVLSPFFLLVAVLVKFSDGGPIFFHQQRVGQFGKNFFLWKFRTMIVDAERLGISVTKDGDPRITRVGRYLRKWKLDELPQLWNVLKGEMSFVGPRPEVPRYVEQYTPLQREILKYKPGITDLATLVFRDEEMLLRSAGCVEDFYIKHCVPRKIELNRQYATKANLAQDIWIIVQTLCPYWIGVLTIYGSALLASFWVAYMLRFEFQVPVEEFEQFQRYWMAVLGLKLFFLLWRKQFHGLLSYFSVPELEQIGTALGAAFLLEMGAWWLTAGNWAPSRSIILIDFLLSLFLLCSIRLTFRLLREKYFTQKSRTDAPALRVAIIGAGELGSKLARKLASNQSLGRKVAAFFDDDPEKWQKDLHGIEIVGMPECLLNGEWVEKLDEVLIAMPHASLERLRQINNMLASTNLKFRAVPSLDQLATGKVAFATTRSTAIEDLLAKPAAETSLAG